MTDDSGMREYVRELFGRAGIGPEQEPEPDAPRSNHVPREGDNTRKRAADYDARDFAGELFGAHPNDRNLYNPDN